MKRKCQQQIEQLIVPNIKLFYMANGADSSSSSKLPSSSIGTTSSTNMVVSQLLRMICSSTPKELHWRAVRSYLLPEHLEIRKQEGPKCVDGQAQGEGDLYTVRLYGHLRGRPLHSSSLIHVCGAGVGRLVSTELMMPAARTAGRGPGECAAADANEHRSSFDLLVEDVGAAGSGREWWIPAGERAVADPLRQESLRKEADNDVLMGEQTWPSEREMAGNGSGPGQGDDGAGRNRRKVPVQTADVYDLSSRFVVVFGCCQIPEGMSSYQADWYIDEEGHWEQPQDESEEEGDGEGDADRDEEEDEEEDCDMSASGSVAPSLAP
eukprot:gene178-179_t